MELVPVITGGSSVVGKKLPVKDNKKEVLANALFAGVLNAESKDDEESSGDSDDSDDKKKRRQRKKEKREKKNKKLQEESK